MKKTTYLFLFCLFCCGKIIAQHVQQIKLMGTYELPHNMLFNGTTIGGLSGIDYYAARNQYYIISDDRSAINPARFYTAKIYFSNKGIDSVSFLKVTNLLQSNAKPYPDTKQDPRNTPDPEAIRYNPLKDELIWTSEGERTIKGQDTILTNPSITKISMEGMFADTFKLPANLYMHKEEKGPRQNGVLEGMSFSNHFQTLFVNLEEPLYEDGPRAAITENKAMIRLYKFDVKSQENNAQYAYLLDPVSYPPVPENAFIVNGVPDILAIDDQHLLVMERSFSIGRLPCTIKIYLADLTHATDIKEIKSLTANNENPQPVSKKLLLNLDDLGIYTDNIEGMCFGPDLPNGHKTLVMVADNNFQFFQKTQFFVFEIFE